MVASRNFLYSCPATWTIGDISIISCPSFKVLIANELALDITMPLNTAFKTNFVFALADDLVSFSFFHKVIAVWPWTPSQLWIHVHINVLLELEIFFVHCLRTEFSNIFAGVFFVTCLFRALYLPYLTVLDAELYVFCDTIQAKSMGTGI
jgi:hypothetical protein